jgi:hypothetical protein
MRKYLNKNYVFFAFKEKYNLPINDDKLKNISEDEMLFDLVASLESRKIREAKANNESIEDIEIAIELKEEADRIFEDFIKGK